MLNGRTAEGLQEFRKLLERNPDASVIRAAGAFLADARQASLASDFFRRIAAADPAARLDLATAVWHAEGARQALGVLNEATEAERNGDYYLLHAVILEALGEHDQMLADLKRAEGIGVARPELACRTVPLLVRNSLPGELACSLAQNLALRNY